MTTENKASIHFQMMLKNHFSCYVVIKATYQSFHSHTALDSVPMPAILLKYIKVDTVSLYDH